MIPPIHAETAGGAATISQLLPDTLPSLLRFARRMTKHPHDAEDLVQCTCLRALECGHQLRPDSSARSWLFTIMYSLWMNELRARQAHGGEHTEWTDTLPAFSVDSPDANLQFRQTMEILGRLPESQREVLQLVAMEGCGYKEAAQLLLLPIGTVMSRLARARVAFEKMLGVGARGGLPVAPPRGTRSTD